MSGIGYIGNADIPYIFDFVFGSAVTIGTDIYLFGGVYDNTYAYKYNTDTGIYTRLTDIPYEFWQGSSVVIGTDIYLFGGYYTRKYSYKYDTTTDIYTRLTGIPSSFSDGNVVIIGTDIYSFGGGYDNTYAYKYNTDTGTYTRLNDIPYEFWRGSSVVIGTDVYLFGGNNSKTYAYKYNTITDIYTRLTDIPYSFYCGSSVVSNNVIYLLGGEKFPRCNCKCNILTYDMNSVKIENVKYVKNSGIGGQFLSDNGTYYPLNSYGTTGGTSTAYTCAISSITSYTDGLEVTILPHIDCGSSPTLKINSLGALTIKNSSGEDLSVGDIKAGVPVSLVRVGSYFFY